MSHMASMFDKDSPSPSPKGTQSHLLQYTGARRIPGNFKDRGAELTLTPKDLN